MLPRIQLPLIFITLLFITFPIKTMKYMRYSKQNNMLSLKTNFKQYCSEESPWSKIIDSWNELFAMGLILGWVGGNSLLSYREGARTKLYKNLDFNDKMPEYLAFLIMPIFSELVLCNGGRAYPKGSYALVQAACFGLGYMNEKIKEK